MSEWETFCDESYYHLWRVRRKSDRNFNDGFHVQDGKEAAALVELLNGLERERDEAREEAEYWKEAAKVPSGIFRSLEMARDQAKRDAEYYRARYEKLKDERKAAR